MAPNWWDKVRADYDENVKKIDSEQDERIKNGTGSWWDKIVGMARENEGPELAGQERPHSNFDLFNPAMKRAGLEGVWETFRQAYETAYEDAKRASHEQQNRGANSSHYERPSRPQRSPYDVLGVRENAPWNEVKSAYRKAMMNLHPDRVSETGMDPKTATMRTQEVNMAYVELENQRFG
jgi:DnaJ domain